jgi:hypothetical protein
MNLGSLNKFMEYLKNNWFWIKENQWRVLCQIWPTTSLCWPSPVAKTSQASPCQLARHDTVVQQPVALQWLNCRVVCTERTRKARGLRQARFRWNGLTSEGSWRRGGRGGFGQRCSGDDEHRPVVTVLRWVPAALDDGEGDEAWINSKENGACGGAHRGVVGRWRFGPNPGEGRRRFGHRWRRACRQRCVGGAEHGWR